MATTALDRKFDRIRAREEAGLLKPARGSRALRKLMSNRLAMLGVAIFTTILLASIFAPLLTAPDLCLHPAVISTPELRPRTSWPTSKRPKIRTTIATARSIL